MYHRPMNQTPTSYHLRLAALWAAYNSLSGRASSKQTDKVARQLSVDDLTRMLIERRISLPDQMSDPRNFNQ